MAAYKKINATEQLKVIMGMYFYELDEASRTKERKIAWCSSAGPVEILRTLGFLVFYPENHAAMLGTTRMSMESIPVANAEGYSPEICSYLTSDIGAFIKGETPISTLIPEIKRVPQPDVLVYNTNQCREVQDWFYWYHKKLNVPLIGINTHRAIGEVTDAHLQSIAQQMREIVPLLEKIADKKFDMDEFIRILLLSKATADLWGKVLDTATNKPSPITFFDGTIHMAPIVVLRGTECVIDYYTVLLDEMEERIKNGIAAVDDEKHRFYWDGMPIWGKLKDLSVVFMKLKACLIASTYLMSWVYENIEPDDPFMSLARAYTEIFIVRSEEEKEKYLIRMFEKFKVNGMIYHDARTCPHNSNNRYGMPQRLFEKTGIPYIVINGDINDLRCFSEEQTRTNIEAFVEGLEESKMPSWTDSCMEK